MAGRTNATQRLVVPVCVGVIGLTLIGLGQVIPNRHAIEDDLTSRSTKALKTADLVGLSVSFSGRDATITGADTADVGERAEAVVSSVQGVRVADAGLSGDDPAAAPAETAAPTAPTSTESSAPATPAASETADATSAPTETANSVVLPVGFTLVGGTITVTGTVRSKSVQVDLLDAVKATGNSWKVVDRLSVNGSLTTQAPKASRLPAVTRLLAQAPIDGTKLVIQYNRGTVILRGTPADAKAEQELLNAAAATVTKKSDVVDGLDTPGLG